jgi:hypothetical protein
LTLLATVELGKDGVHQCHRAPIDIIRAEVVIEADLGYHESILRKLIR